MAAVLWEAARRAPGLPSGRLFRRPPPPSEGTRAAAKQRYQSPPREEEEPELQLRPRWTRRASPHLSPGPAGFGGEPGRGPWTRWARRWPPTKVGHFGGVRGLVGGSFGESRGPANAREDRRCGLAGRPNPWPQPAEPSPPPSPRGRLGLAAALPGSARAPAGPGERGVSRAASGLSSRSLSLVPCPLSPRPAHGVRSSCRSVPVSGRAVGSGPGQVGPSEAGSAEARAARLVVSFFFDRNGVIVGAGKLRRVPTMGTLSCRAGWVAGCTVARPGEPRIGLRRPGGLSPPPPAQGGPGPGVPVAVTVPSVSPPTHPGAGESGVLEGAAVLASS